MQVIDFENLSFYLYKQVFQNRNFIEKISCFEFPFVEFKG